MNENRASKLALVFLENSGLNGRCDICCNIGLELLAVTIVSKRSIQVSAFGTQCGYY